jgi:hypothetical protein
MPNLKSNSVTDSSVILPTLAAILALGYNYPYTSLEVQKSLLACSSVAKIRNSV